MSNWVLPRITEDFDSVLQSDVSWFWEVMATHSDSLVVLFVLTSAFALYKGYTFWKEVYKTHKDVHRHYMWK